MSPGEIYSHPGKRLEDHLLRTWNIAVKIAAWCRLNLDQVMEEALLLHDLAKSHPIFQKKLEGERRRFNHAEPSAVLVLARTGNLICAEAVRRHHTTLENLADIKHLWGNHPYAEWQKTIGRLPWWPGAARLAGKLGADICHWSDLLPGTDAWEDLIFGTIDLYTPDSEGALSDWLRLRLFTSILVTADRLEAMGGDIACPPLMVDRQKINNYITSLQGKKLAAWRGQVRQKVITAASQIIQAPGIYTLTLPTGAGKTLIGLQVALENAARLEATGIIYVLPFVSLVEQNAAVAREVFPAVMEDHHLSFTDGALDEETEEDEANRRFIAFYRYWQEPVIVTTLAKLWEVLYSPRVNDTMSFHRLSRAIVILDEPQSIPVRCWQGFGKTLELLKERLGTTFILMTATQPGLATGLELAPEPVSFPAVRHEFHWLNRRMTIEEAAAFLAAKGALHKDCLIVLNTREAALRMYLAMKARGAEPLFLSAWVAPVHREEILRQLKAKEQRGEPRCLVATQVIEAGMDLDFAIVFRDLGPMDSIVQVAGRCNRHAGPWRGQIYLAELVDERGRNFASYVYDSTLLNLTRQVLREYFDEKDCREIIRAYFRALQGAIQDSELWRNIIEGRWGEYVDLYTDKRPDEVMLVVQGAVEGAEARVSRLLGTISAPLTPEDKGDYARLEKRRQAFREITRHAISVPKKHLDEWYQREGGMIYGLKEPAIREIFPDLWLVQDKGIGRIYRRETGFVPVKIATLMEGGEDAGC
ncbi:MAG: hypothetical protein PWQ18_215 [Clostridia bacterium]|nr:hypothetical protein [Clostridia bacterium]